MWPLTILAIGLAHKDGWSFKKKPYLSILHFPDYISDLTKCVTKCHNAVNLSRDCQKLKVSRLCDSISDWGNVDPCYFSNRFCFERHHKCQKYGPYSQMVEIWALMLKMAMIITKLTWSSDILEAGGYLSFCSKSWTFQDHPCGPSSLSSYCFVIGRAFCHWALQH